MRLKKKQTSKYESKQVNLQNKHLHLQERWDSSEIRSGERRSRLQRPVPPKRKQQTIPNPQLCITVLSRNYLKG